MVRVNNVGSDSDVIVGDSTFTATGCEDIVVPSKRPHQVFVDPLKSSYLLVYKFRMNKIHSGNQCKHIKDFYGLVLGSSDKNILEKYDTT